VSSNSGVRLLSVIVIVVLSLGLILALSACMGQWFTREQTAFLVIGTPVITGTHGEVIISVVNMPQEGMAVMAVNVDGLTYTNTKISNIILVGLNGFTVLASEFDDTTGRCRKRCRNSSQADIRRNRER